MVLPDRIELSTSPLPMECSTTELRQHARYQGIGLKGPYRRPVLATRAPLVQARGRGRKGPKSPKIGEGCFDGGQLGLRLESLDPLTLFILVEGGEAVGGHSPTFRLSCAGDCR